jgi:hypothetical protein
VFLTLGVNSDQISYSKPKQKSPLEIFNEQQNSLNNPKAPPRLGLPKGPIFWEGWVKYFHYSTQPVNRPSSFFINGEYFQQRILKSDLRRKDDKGYKNIPTQFFFYGILMLNNFNIVHSRKIAENGQTTQDADTLLIDNILPLVQGIRSGSIRDLGHFPEGHCIQIFTNKPQTPNTDWNVEKDQGDRENWIICLENEKVKKNLLKKFEELKLAKQLDAERKMKENPGKKNPTVDDFTNQLLGTSKYEKRKDHKPSDGFWILLQDWSQCTLKCGGGKSYQHWMCVPPKKGGRPCLGNAIRYKNCNMKPCPGHKYLPGEPLLNNANSDLNVILKPIIRSLPTTPRRQNYMKCVIKESDVFFKKTQEEYGVNKIVPMPSRIVMNNRTISLYEGDTYDKTVFAFELRQTVIGHYVEDSCCFNLQSNYQQFQVCGGFGGPCKGFVNEWISHFNLFKNNCYQEMNQANWQKATMKSALDEAMAAAGGAAGLNDRENMINNKLHENSMNSIQKKIGATQSMALKVLQKEMDIEKMLQQEMQLKALQEAKELLAKKKREEQKKKLLEQALRDRELENQRIRDSKEAELEIQRIKAETKKEVENKRLALRKKIDEIKKKAARRKRLIEQDINVVRSQIYQELVDANKNGDSTKCSNAYGHPKKINMYCDANIIDDFNKNLQCKKPINFCYVCCEIEFGNMNIGKRDKCYDLCDDLTKKDLDKGEFDWQH